MEINPNVLRELCSDAGTERMAKAISYNIAEKVNFLNIDYENSNNFEIKAMVKGTQNYITYVLVQRGEIEDISCTCPDYVKHYGVCKHSLATVLALRDKKNLRINEKEDELIQESFDAINKENIKNENNDAKYRGFKKIVTSFYNEEIDEIDYDDEEKEIQTEGKIIIEPKIIYDRFSNDMKVEFKIGEKRLYKIKELSEFYDRMINKIFYRYGDKLQFIHAKEAFKKEYRPLLDFILKYAEIIKYANSNSNSNYRYYGKALNDTNIVLSNTGLDDLFEILKGKEVKFQKDYAEGKVEFVDGDPDIQFILNKEKNEYTIFPNTDIFHINILKGKQHIYILQDNKLNRITNEFRKTTFKLLKSFRQNYVTELHLKEEDLPQLFSIIIPKVKDAVKIGNVNMEEIKKYIPKELQVKVFLDFDENNYIVADVKFCYGNFEFNPLDEKKKIEIPRNMVKETQVLNVFRKTGFMFDVKNIRFILPDDDKIYEFLTNDITYYMQKFEVLVTDNFKTKEIIKPKISSLGVKVENDLLTLDFTKIDFDIKELKNIMQKYKLKKKYHRLKNGTFLELDENKEIDFFDKIITGMEVDYKQIESGEIRLPVNRSLYLNQLLKGIKGTEVIKNHEYKEIINNLEHDMLEEYELPKKLNANLRYYQKTGYNWIKILDRYHFGGILADDMGLGKTLQILSVILSYVEETKTQENCKNKPSIVISPSSLTLNWFNEAQKFTPDLKVQVIRGTAKERKAQIEDIENYDLVITSYDLLKRDIEIYKQKKYDFRFAIADEAQYLKNSTTQNAKAIKQIQAQSRFALTGTPIENSLAELWSIFDFIMPGYLFEYKKFKSMYEVPILKENDERAMKKLKMLIEPFVLRRVKKEVLTELPEKTITVLNNEMEDEQEKIYLTYLAQAKEELSNEIQINGFEKSQIKILALLTRLRQICCHPRLFLENYRGSSSKLEQCIEIVEDATEAGHKILIFSTYTSMFEIMQEELDKRNIPYFKLTGSTNIDERIKMVDEFNESSKVKVFLISLKAGGTGLNLTGADMVIHYDPWWNLSAENQATDRAYRIGQKNNVQVYKLITKNSIEEKIYDLQMKKSELVENVLSTKTTFVNKLSRDEIMNLFGGF